MAVFLNEQIAPISDAKQALPSDLESPPADTAAKTIILFHDETTFQANDYECTQ